MQTSSKREMEERLGVPIIAMYANDHGWRWYLTQETEAGVFNGYVISPHVLEGEWGAITESDLQELQARPVDDNTARCIQGTCKKCRRTVFIDIGQLTIEQVKEYLFSKKSFECPGRHVELYDLLGDYYVYFIKSVSCLPAWLL